MNKKGTEDIEQKVRRAVGMHRNDDSFPKIEDYGGSEELLDDYFYTRSYKGGVEEQKKSYTIYGILLVVPLAVAFYFFKDIMALVLGFSVGGGLCLRFQLFLRMKAARKERKFREARIEEFIGDVLERVSEKEAEA